MLRFVGTVLRDFFWLQFSVKLRLRKIPIVNVDHELDAAIPFVPAQISTYLDFIAFWIRPIGQIRRRFGRAAERRAATELLNLLTSCYRQASEVYRVRMTTTRRPRYLRGRFLVIHLFDPHYLCVPSLHIMIVAASYSFYRRVFAELGAPAAETTQVGHDLFTQAIQIAESVLYIKQHSVNCVPAALYAMSQLTPTEFTAAEATVFINQLFADPAANGPVNASVQAADATAIREHIQATFDHLTSQGATDPDWMTTVRRFVASSG